MKNKNILIISDMVGLGNLSITAMLPIFSYMGYSTYNLPTSLVSNNFGYGKYKMLDTTDYLKGAINAWDKLGFSFSAIATGFIPSEAQAQVIARFCKKQAKNGARIFVDPVMADGGELYHGLPKNIVKHMRDMLKGADLCYPKYTEACLLTDEPFREGGLSHDEAIEMTDKLRKLGPKSVLITSIIIDGRPSVIGYNHLNGEYFIVNYEEIPITFSGTGDVFSATLIGHIMKGDSLKKSTKLAMNGVYNLITLNKDAADPYMGLPLEKYLNIL
jgi:pyridoxine kinase